MKKPNRLAFLLITVVMLTLSIAPCIAAASAYAAADIQSAEHIWTGASDTAWFDGQRTSYDISTPEQLAGLSQLVAEGNRMQGVTINLVSDIVLNDTGDFDSWETTPPANLWTPIGNGENKPFSGVFHGNGHTIQGLYAAADDAAGLFGYLYCAGVVQVLLKECFVQASTTGEEVCAGGIAAKADGVLLSECAVDGKVIAYAPPNMMNGYDSTYAGGIVGACTVSTESVGAIFTQMLFMCAGYMVNPALLNDGSGGMIKSFLITDCISAADVIVYDAAFDCDMGGIVGYGHTGLIVNSVWFGSMYGTRYNSNAITAGGIAGMVFNCSADRCYYTSQLNTGFGQIESQGVHDVIDHTVCMTEEELAALDADTLKEALGEAYVSVHDRIYLKNDRSIWHILYGDSGDINLDGAVSIADAVLMQKFLMSLPNAELANWRAGDLYADGKLNAADLTLLKRQIMINP